MGRNLSWKYAALAVASLLADEHFGDTPVQKSTSCEACLFIHQGAQFLMAEVIGQRLFVLASLHLVHQAQNDQFFQGSDSLFLAATTCLAQCITIERTPDDGSRIEQLPTDFAHRVQARVEQITHTSWQ